MPSRLVGGASARIVALCAGLVWYLAFLRLACGRAYADVAYQVFAPQRTLEWFVARYGRIGASTAAVPCGISPHNAPRDLWQVLFAPGVDPRMWDFPSTVETAHGTKYEPLACMLYELLSGNWVTQTGLWINANFFSWEHSSPDGFVYDPSCVSPWRRLVEVAAGVFKLVDHLLEIKCPLYKLYESVPAQYLAQVQQQMRTLDFGYADFFVYHHEEAQCALWRIYRCDAWTEWSERKFETFAQCKSADEAHARLPWLAKSMQVLIDTQWNWRAAAAAQSVTVEHLKAHLPNTPVRIERLWQANLRTTTLQRACARSA